MRVMTVIFCLFVSVMNSAVAADPLPSWNAGPTKDAIINFVKCATNDGCPLYIPPQDRIAVFDNDGTL